MNSVVLSENGAPLQVSSPKRNEKIDVLKGLAIICMVAAHCGCPYTDFIYLFHMAVFLMASGYFYNAKNSATLITVAKYSFHKILALYIPYVLFNGALVLAHNFLVEINIYSSNPLFEEIGGYGAVWGRQWPYTLSFMKDVLLNVLSFKHEPQLAGANWFLRVLCYISIGHCVVIWAINKIKHKGLRILVLGLFLACCSIVTIKVQTGEVTIPGTYKNFVSCYLAYVLGIFLRRADRLLRYDLTAAIFSFVLLYLLDPLGGISLNVGWINTLDFYIICSLLGWILLRSVAELAEGKISLFLAYAGRYSMSIVFLHFISFKLVTLAVVLLRGDNIVLLASFPQLDGAENGLWIVYTIVGTVVPLLINAAYQYGKGKIKCLIKRFV